MSMYLNSAAIEEIANIDDLRTKMERIKTKVGDLHGVDVMYNMVLLAAFVRPNKTKGGLYRPQSNVEEDIWQGKVGLVLKLGPDAFMDGPDFSFNGQKAKHNEWVVFKTGDAWQLTINDWPCRLVRDSAIRMKLQDPSMVV